MRPGAGCTYDPGPQANQHLKADGQVKHTVRQTQNLISDHKDMPHMELQDAGAPHRVAAGCRGRGRNGLRVVLETNFLEGILHHCTLRFSRMEKSWIENG